MRGQGVIVRGDPCLRGCGGGALQRERQGLRDPRKGRAKTEAERQEQDTEEAERLRQELSQGLLRVGPRTRACG